MLELFIKAFGLLFIAIGPLDNAVLFAGIGHDYRKAELRSMAWRASFVAFIIIFFFAIGGSYVLSLIGIGLPSLQIAGGILLMVFSIQMVMDEYERGEDFAEKHKHKDLSIFPFAMPLLAGPAAITQGMLLVAEQQGDYRSQGVVVLALVVVMLICYVLFRTAGWFSKYIGDKVAELIVRVVGILLAAIAADLIVRGVKASEMFLP